MMEPVSNGPRDDGGFAGLVFEILAVFVELAWTIFWGLLYLTLAALSGIITLVLYLFGDRTYTSNRD